MATDVAVVIPWRSTPDRIPALEVSLKAWYARGAQPVLVDSGHPRFNLAASRNGGVIAAQGLRAAVVVVADADTIPAGRGLDDAIAAARTSGRVHLPYTEYRGIGPKGSGRVRAGEDPSTVPDQLVIPGACSGIFVAAPETWWSIGGMDERFTVWAPEDYAFRLAHETLLGPLERHPGPVFALHHQDQPSKAQGPEYDACVALYQRYVDAHQDADAMRALVGLG